MSQPLTLTLARKAPRTTQIAGSLLVACLLILPFFACCPPRIRWRYRPGC
jgi:urea transport system permease protein